MTINPANSLHSTSAAALIEEKPVLIAAPCSLASIDVRPVHVLASSSSSVGVSCKRKFQVISQTEQAALKDASLDGALAKRSRAEKLNFDEIISIRVIKESSLGDSVLDLKAKTNFDDRSSRSLGACRLREVGRSLDCGLSRSPTEHAHQVKIMGPSVDYESLLNAVIEDGVLKEKSLHVSSQQEYYANLNRFQYFFALANPGGLDRSEQKALAQFAADHLSHLLDLQDALPEAEKIKTVAKLQEAFYHTIPNVREESISKEAFVDLITRIDRGAFLTAKATKKSLFDKAIESSTTSGVIDQVKFFEKFSEELKDFNRDFVSSKKVVRELSVESLAAALGNIPHEIIMSSDFLKFYEDVTTGDWKDGEERVIHIKQVRDDLIPFFDYVVNGVFMDPNFQGYLFATRGITPS